MPILGVSMNLSHLIAQHVATSNFDALPTSAKTAAKQSLLDAVGVTLAASALGEGAGVFADIARQASNRDGATVLGFGFRAAPAMAAFANGAMAHALDYEDTFDAALVHPNAAVVPAALAIAETTPDCQGTDLIAAVAIGADLTCRLGMAIDGHETRGFGVRFLCGALGATAATGKLLRLSEEELLHAFALVLFQASFSSEAMGYSGSHMRAVREAFPAKAAVIAAQLARGGVKAFDRPFDGQYGFFGLYAKGGAEEDVFRDGLGERFRGAEVSFKPWPSCRGTHAYVEAAQKIMTMNGLAADAIERADAVVSPFFRALCEPPERKRRPATAIDAKFSIPFTVAVALQRGTVGLDDFLPDRLHDPALLRLADRVDHRIEPSWPTEEATRGVLTLHLRDGRSLKESVETPLGHPDHPMSEAAMSAKFADCARYARTPIAQNAAVMLAERIVHLEEDRSLATLFRS
jgi:2-methylcitrate dehydratase PrpD